MLKLKALTDDRLICSPFCSLSPLLLVSFPSFHAPVYCRPYPNDCLITVYALQNDFILI